MPDVFWMYGREMNIDTPENVIIMLRDALDSYDRVVLIDDSMYEADGFRVALSSLCKQDCLGKVLFFSKDDHPESGTEILLRHITEAEASAMRSLYYTYSFSPRFILLTLCGNYGSVFRMVDAGLLSIEEAVMCVLADGTDSPLNN